MTEEERKQFKDMKDRLERLERSDRYTFSKRIQILDGRVIEVGKTLGTIIATEPTQKLGFFGTTPIVQSGAISDPSGGATVDSQARTKIIEIKSALENYGLLDV